MTYLRRNGRLQRRRGNLRYYMLLRTNLNQFTLGGLSARFLNSAFAFSANVPAVPRFASKAAIANRSVNRDIRESYKYMQWIAREHFND